MKAVITTWSLLLGFLVLSASSLSAQTKKIALRSHAGSNMIFTFDLPDDFGMVDPKMYENSQKELKQDSTAIVDTTTCKAPARLEKAALTPKEQRAARRQQKKETRKVKQQQKKASNELPGKISASSSVSKKNTTSTAAMFTAPQGVTGWLWLLVLPLAVVFVVSLKKP